jgi:hypothetical protein
LLLWLAAYVGWVGGGWFYERYFIGFALLLTLGSARLFGPALRGRVAGILLAVALAAYGLASTHVLQRRLQNPSVEYMQWVPLVRRSIADGERIGTFQSGLLGYATRGAIVNLDGVVNPEAARALEENRMDDYVLQLGLTQIVDLEWIVSALLIGRADAGRLELELLRDGAPAAWRIHERTPEWLDRRRNETIPGGQILFPGDAEFSPAAGWPPRRFLSPHESVHELVAQSVSIDWAGPAAPGRYRVSLRFNRLIPPPREADRLWIQWPGGEVWASVEIPPGDFMLSHDMTIERPNERLRLALRRPDDWKPQTVEALRFHSLTVSPLGDDDRTPLP